MASQKVQGLNIKLSADTTAIESALKDANKSINSTQKELTQVNKLLKFDPSNVNLLTQKQSLLSNAIKDTTKKLEELQKAKELADKDTSIDKNTKEYRDLVRQIEQAQQQLSKFNKEARETDGALKEATKGASQFGDTLKAILTSDVIKGGFNLLKSGFSKVVDLTKQAISGVVSLVKQGVEYNATMQSYQTSIKAMLNDDEKATNRLIKSMKQLGQQSGYANDVLLEGARNLLSADISAEETTTTIEAMARALYGVGASNDDLSRMITNLQGIASSGKATAQDLKQFKNIGVNASKLVAEATGKTVEQVEKAGITFKDLSNAFIKASEEGGRYATVFEDLSGTFQAQVNAIQSNWQQLLGNLTLDTTSAITNSILPAINDLLASMNNAYEEAESNTTKFNEFIDVKGGNLTDSLNNIETNGVRAMANAFTEGLSGVINTLSDEGVLEDILSGASNIIDTIASAFDPNTEQGEKNKEALDNALSKFLGIIDQFFKDHRDDIVAIGTTIGGAIVEGIKTAFKLFFADNQEYIDISNQYSRDIDAQMWGSGGYGNVARSGGFGALQSGGYGNITLNASFVANGNLDEAQARRFATLMVEQINEELGGQL